MGVCRGVGVDAEYFEDVCGVLETAMRNQGHEKLSISAAHIVPAVAQRLAHSTEKVTRPLHTMQAQP